MDPSVTAIKKATSMPLPSSINDLEESGGFELLIDEAAYKAFHARNDVSHATIPLRYPCFAIVVFDTETYYHYLYLGQFEQMMPVAVATTERPGDYELLTDEAAYVAHHAKNRATEGEPPTKYPCFALKTFDNQEETYYHYLYPEDLARMRAAIAALAETPDPTLT